MKNYFLLIILLFSFSACRTATTVPVKTETKITERIVPVTIPSDSAVVKLQFSVDTTTNKLSLSGYSESKTTSVQTQVKQSSNVVEILFKVPERHEKVIATDTVTSRDVIIPVQVEKKNVLSTVVPWVVAGFFLILFIVIVLIKAFK